MGEMCPNTSLLGYICGDNNHWQTACHNNIKASWHPLPLLMLCVQCVQTLQLQTAALLHLNHCCFVQSSPSDGTGNSNSRQEQQQQQHNKLMRPQSCQHLCRA